MKSAGFDLFIYDVFGVSVSDVPSLVQEVALGLIIPGYGSVSSSITQKQLVNRLSDLETLLLGFFEFQENDYFTVKKIISYYFDSIELLDKNLQEKIAMFLKDCSRAVYFKRSVDLLMELSVNELHILQKTKAKIFFYPSTSQVERKRNFRIINNHMYETLMNKFNIDNSMFKNKNKYKEWTDTDLFTEYFLYNVIGIKPLDESKMFFLKVMRIK